MALPSGGDAGPTGWTPVSWTRGAQPYCPELVPTGWSSTSQRRCVEQRWQAGLRCWRLVLVTGKCGAGPYCIVPPSLTFTAYTQRNKATMPASLFLVGRRVE